MRALVLMRCSLALLVAAGCSSEPSASPDAPVDTVDAAIDASEAVVTVTITEGGVPAVGASVYFQNPDSSLVRATSTDLDGKARAPVIEGGFVTVIDPRPIAIGVPVIRDRISTFAGVKPGDELYLDLPPAVGVSTVNFRLATPVDPAAESYMLYTSCGRAQLGQTSPSTPSAVSLAGCGGIADMLVVTLDLIGQPLRALYRSGQPVTEGASITLTGPYVDVQPVTVTVTGTPVWVRNQIVELIVTSARGPMFPGFATIEPPTTMATIGLPIAAATTVTARTEIFAMEPAVARQRILAWGLPVANQTIDAGAAALRQITTRPTFNPATRTVTWTEDPGQDPDLVRIELYTYREGDPAHAWIWEVVAPYGDRPSLTYPVLPVDVADAFTTTVGDSFSVPSLETLRISGGYDRIRPRALRRALDEVPPGPVGQLTYQYLYEQFLLASPTLGPSATFTRATR